MSREESKRQESIPFLSKIKGDSVKSPKESGVWENNPQLLNDLPLDLYVKGEISSDALTAIPTIWARPLLFADALVNDDHPLHDQIKNEWRGLLGLFCFKDFYKMDISTARLELSKDSNLRFEKTLYALRPSNYWDEFHIIYFEGKVIGGTSPLSLFYTAVDYHCNENNPPWQTEEGRLKDPVEYFESRGMIRELAILKRWLQDAKANLANIRIPGDDTKDSNREKLLNALEEWIRSINVKEEQEFREKITYIEPVVNQMPYQLLSAKVQKVTGTDGSDYILAVRRESFTGARPIVIWEEGWNDKRATVYGLFKTTDIQYPKEAKGDKLLGGKIDNPWIRPDLLFFTKKMIKLAGLQKQNILLYHEDGYIPPLTDEILKYFSAEDIAKERIFEWRESRKGIEAILKLPLKSKGNIRRYAILSKTYDTKDIIAPDIVPDLVLWPDFKAEGWDIYYLIQRAITNEKYESVPAATVIERKVGDFLTILKNYPEAIKCVHKDASIGLILIHQPTPTEKLNKEWNVAVDFGTSNTTVAYQEIAGEKPKLLSLKDHFTILTVAEPEILRDYLCREFLIFLGSENLPMPFPTIFKEVERMESKSQPFLDGIIVFRHPLNWAIQIEPKGVKSNLKWSLDSNERKCISTFINQTVLMVCAEAICTGVSKIKFSWSYPSAFAKYMESDMKTYWQKWHRNSDYGIEKEVIGSMTESIAVGKYYGGDEPLAGLDRPQVICDIGGGTSDIAIWLEKNIIAQTSVRLAGNILADYMKKISIKDRNLIDDIANKIRMEPAELHRLFHERPSVTLNILLQLPDTGRTIYESIVSDAAVSDMSERQRARSIIFFSFSAVFYYIGLLLRNLASQKEITSCDIHFAGNGPKLFNWIGASYEVKNAFKNILDDSLKPYKLDTVTINDPIEPKAEVGIGLLSKVDYLDENAVSIPSILIGENGYLFDGDTKKYNYDIYNIKDTIRNSNMRAPDNFPELEKFITVYDNEAKKLGFVEIKSLYDKSRIKAKMSTYIADIKSKDSSEVLFQPFFIEQVKVILEEQLIGGKNALS